jgi:hypothetical protein
LAVPADNPLPGKKFLVEERAADRRAKTKSGTFFSIPSFAEGHSEK